MNDYVELIAPDTVRFEKLLPGPIERVWSFLTESEKRGRWLHSGMMELEVGGHVEMHFHNAGLSSKPDIPPPEKYKDMPEHVYFTGTVTAYNPPYLLSHTWETEGESSEVCYELKEQGDHVLLTLTHRKLTSPDEITGVSGGWHTHFEILADVLAGKEPEAFWKRHTALETEYEARQAET